MFQERKLTCYVASSQDFPHLSRGFKISFNFPNNEHPGRKHYIFKTSEIIKNIAYRQEAENFNKILNEAKAAGFELLVITAEASFGERKNAINTLLVDYDPRDWYPEAPDTYHDSGYFFSDSYLRTTPVYQHIVKNLNDHCPPVRMDQNESLWEIGSWIDSRYASRPKS